MEKIFKGEARMGWFELMNKIELRFYDLEKQYGKEEAIAILADEESVSIFAVKTWVAKWEGDLWQ